MLKILHVESPVVKGERNFVSVLEQSVGASTPNIHESKEDRKMVRPVRIREPTPEIARLHHSLRSNLVQQGRMMNCNNVQRQKGWRCLVFVVVFQWFVCAEDGRKGQNENGERQTENPRKL